ncbi:MAG: restriction endonuclease [Candidatus Aenigmarchaeota archaeon]|nr:restriction endonuclease [Candidatus Aenigmarchaeota archaeon]
MVMIIKADGTKVPFDREKAKRSCENASASSSLAEEIITIVEQNLREGMTTSEMKKMIYSELDKRESHTAAIYNIRKAIAALDPVTHQFEKYICHLYQYYGYETEWSPVPKPQGFCTDHEIDVLLRKGDEISFVECKHHFSYHRFTGLKVPMRVWARLQDLKDGFEGKKEGSYNFKEAIIVTNTKFSAHAQQYAECKNKNLELVGWNYPDDNGCLNNLIEKKRAYPLTILNLDAQTVLKLCELGVHDIKDFVYVSPDILTRSGLSREKIGQLSELVENIVGKK